MAVEKPWHWIKDYLTDEEYASLVAVRSRVEDLTKAPFHLHFTDHSVEHSDRIMERLREILWSNLTSDKRLNHYELMVLACAVYLHDLGMQWIYDMTKSKYVQIDKPPTDAYEMVRDNHAARSAIIVRGNLGTEKVKVPDLGIKSPKPVAELGTYIADCVEHHQGEYKVEAAVDEFCGDRIRMGLLRGLLRVGDTLDMDHRRVDMEKLSLFDISPKSKEHWFTHHYVKSIKTSQGKVKVAFDFPNSVAPPIARHFVSRVLDKIEDELKRHHELFWQEMVFLELDRNETIPSSFETGLVKLALPEDLEEYVNNEISRERKQGKGAEAPTLVPAADKAPDDWISYWGFAGNPWVDLPASIKQEDFVMTKNLTNIVSVMHKVFEGKTGQIQLLIGERGMGKTSFFDSLSEIFPWDRYDIAIVSLGDDISVFHTSRELSTFLFARLYRHMRGKMPEKVEVADLKEAVNEYHVKRLIVCFDNLDRFTEKQDVDTIQKFFAESQAALQAVGRKAMVVIASAPEWAPMFESEKLGYVNFENAWRLTQFSPEEALELVRKRLLIAGKPIDDVFAPGVIGLINKMEGGNPRRILRRCSNLTESAATKGIRPISKEFILKHHSAKVENDLAKLMWNLASKSEAHKQALGAIYFFYETMEREALDVDKGWSAFLQLTEGEVPVSRLDPDYVTSLASVSDRVQQEGQEPSRRLKKNVAEYLREWSTDGLSPADFVSFFRVKPVHPKEFNVEILRQVRASALPEDVRWYVEGARGHYKQATDDNVFPTKVVDLSWRAVEYLLKGYLIKAGAVKEGAFSDDKIGEDRYLDNYGRLRWKKPERLVAEARAIFGKFTDLKNAKGLYVKTYDQMRLLLRKREQLLNAGVSYKADAIKLAHENAKICRVAVRQVYAELVTLF